jgi:aminoglycoside 3-N-acetyltransferase
MKEVSIHQIIDCLQQLKIQDGDGLLIHSAIQFLGQPVDGIGMYLKAIQSVIGEKGTIAVPVFNFGFAKGKHFDPQSTPSQKMGAFSEYVRQHPKAMRTKHPMQSLAVIGYHAKDLASRDTASAFDPGSAFDRMYQLGFKLLLLGADERAISMLHYCEQRAEVPYRYWKEFQGQILKTSGWEECTYRMYVRDLDIDPQLTLKPVVSLMKKKNQWSIVPLNYGEISSCSLVDFVEATDQIMINDPYALVLNKPEAKRL